MYCDEMAFIGNDQTILSTDLKYILVICAITNISVEDSVYVAGQLCNK